MANDAHEDPAFQAMCREHEIEGTAMVALCGSFWNRALASTTGEAEQCRTCGETQPHTGSCGTSDSDTQALCKRAPPAATPAAPAKNLITIDMDALARAIDSNTDASEQEARSIINTAGFAAPAPASEAVADWSNRRTDSLAGWINELATLAEHPTAMPAFARRAMRTIVRGLRTHAAPVQQAGGLTDEQIRKGFRDYDKELVARHRTAWQIWRDSSAWTQGALKGEQPAQPSGSERGNGS